MSEQRPLPHSDDAEISVIGAAMQSKSALAAVIRLLDETDFYRVENAEVFRACKILYEADKPVDLVTMHEELKKRGTVSMIGGVAYLANCTSLVPSPSSAPYYCEVIREKAMLRKLIQTSWDITQRSFEAKDEPGAILDDAEDAILGIAKDRQRGIGEVPEPAKLAALFSESIGKSVEQIRTPFGWVNDMTAGLIPGNLFTIAGRTSAGKSAFALQLAKMVADKYKVVYDSLEMLPTELVARYISSETDISQRDLMLHNVPAQEKDAFDRSLKRYAASNLYFTAAGRDIPGIERIIKSQQPQLMIIDTVNLVKSSGESERVKLLNVTRELKQLALKENVPIIILAQLSRKADEKLAPTLADIKESASIEEDSDVVLLLTEIEDTEKFEKIVTAGRIDLGLDTHEFREMKSNGERLIFAMIQKNRNGKLGRAAFRFEGRRFKFTEIGAAEPKTQLELGDDDDMPF